MHEPSQRKLTPIETHEVTWSTVYLDEGLLVNKGTTPCKDSSRITNGISFFIFLLVISVIRYTNT